MTRQILIDSIVRQTMVLIAQLATSGGVRSPLAQIADRVFLDLANELEQQGISRKVSADMFGMALRSYRRRVRQLGESSTDRGRSLWEAVLEFVSRGELVTRQEVLKRFDRDEDALVKGVLNDLCESALVLRLGTGKDVAYRGATPDEIASVLRRSEGLVELVWVIVYREGPVSREELARRTSLEPETLGACLAELVKESRITQDDGGGGYRTRSVFVPLGSEAGWEAALLDHFQAVVKAMCQRLRANDDAAPSPSGGSTYTYSVWDGHPLADEVRGLLQEFRTRHSELRTRVRAHNERHAAPAHYDRVTFYGGSYVIPEGPEEEES